MNKSDNVENGKRITVTHGELAFVPVSRAPKGNVTKCKTYVAGHSETGHHHILESKSDIEIVEKDSERYAVIKDLAKLWHKKSFDVHETRILQPGVYKINEKTEYNPFTKTIERVFD